MERSLPSLRRDLEYGFVDRDIPANLVENPLLVANQDESTMFGVLRAELEEADEFIFSVAFISADGIGAIKQQLQNFPGRGTIVTGTYLDFNEPAALRELLTLTNVDVYVMDGVPHHAKGYIFTHQNHVTALIGSSNLTRNALMSNQEWNLRFSAHQDGDIAWQLREAARRHVAAARPLTEAWIQEYEKKRRSRAIVIQDDQPVELTATGERILPNAMQVEALSELDAVLKAGEQRALIISATGTGKTILAALAVRQLRPRRTLFIVHREQILRKAAESFKAVLEIADADIGFYVGPEKQLDRTVVFSTIQSLSRPENLSEISPLQFDLIIFDEVHRSGAHSYQAVMKHFRPEFMLGLTATPERTDGFNIFELFDYNVPYEIRLEGALENHMLVPFDYYGVTDFETARGSIGDRSNLSELVSSARVDYIVRTLQEYSFAQGTKGLVFCSRNDEAAALSTLLNQRFVHGRLLRTVALSGANSTEERERAVAQLEAGDLDYILTVDIFNEGIDIPSVNVVVLLRSTQSSIIFTQQLGRGLRKSTGKRSLRVIDFIGNYANNYLIPIALTGDRSHNKDRIVDKLRRTRRHPAAGHSTVSFDEVSTRRVLESLQKARITDRRAKREEITKLQARLGRIPQLADFVFHEAMDPFVLAATDTKARNYWALLSDLRFVDADPSQSEDGFLSMLTIEIMNGKRPQELLLLRELLKRGPGGAVHITEFDDIVRSWNAALETSELTLRSVERVLDFTWLKEQTAARYGGHPIATRVGDEFRLGEKFAGTYFSYVDKHLAPETSFRAHVDDVVHTGLLLNAQQYAKQDSFLVGKTYTRKDAARLLNWAQNLESTMYGYRVDADTATCPIFVTYHKDADAPASVRYEDTLLDRSTMHWFSRHGRNLQSRELAPILAGEVELHLFVQREDADGSDHYYLGQVDATNPQQRTMRNDKGSNLDVVSTDLKIRVPIEASLFNTITAGKLVDEHGR